MSQLSVMASACPPVVCPRPRPTTCTAGGDGGGRVAGGRSPHLPLRPCRTSATVETTPAFPQPGQTARPSPPAARTRCPPPRPGPQRRQGRPLGRVDLAHLDQDFSARGPAAPPARARRAPSPGGRRSHPARVQGDAAEPAPGRSLPAGGVRPGDPVGAVLVARGAGRRRRPWRAAAVLVPGADAARPPGGRPRRHRPVRVDDQRLRADHHPPRPDPGAYHRLRPVGEPAH